MNNSIKILKVNIPVSYDYLSIYELKYLRDNPRVFSCTHEVENFDELTIDEQQTIIYEKLSSETSVKNLVPDIEKHGGLLEPILVRHDTKEVIEGNSRLAVFHRLHEKYPDNEEWELIPCQIVSRLSDEQQDALLNQIHVKGKTQWTAYEKANFAYVRYDRGIKETDIAERFGETLKEIKTRIETIRLMKKNQDSNMYHFSYYDVIVRSKAISDGFSKNNELRCFILNKIRNLTSNDDNNDNTDKNEFTAQDLRNKLPKIINKNKILKRYIRSDLTFDDAYQSARISVPLAKVKRARASIEGVDRPDLEKLDRNDINALKEEIRKLVKDSNRLKSMLETVLGN